LIFYLGGQAIFCFKRVPFFLTHPVILCQFFCYRVRLVFLVDFVTDIFFVGFCRR
jgi:hypothetical protein